MIKDLLQDIIIAKENKAYFASLALALTIPDICGKIQYINGTDRDKYIRWFNCWIRKYLEIQKSANGNFDEFDKLACFDGKTCYALRCAILHCGTTNLKDDTTVDVKLDRFELCICDGEWQMGDSHGCCIENDVIVNVYRRINVINLLNAFISGINMYLKVFGDESERYGNIKIIKF